MAKRIDTKDVMQAVVKSRNGTTAKRAAHELGVPVYSVYKLRKAIDVLGEGQVDSLVFSGKSVTAIDQMAKASQGQDEKPLAEILKEEIETLVISEGEHTGENFKVLDWEEKFLQGIATHTNAALTIARGNGKTTLVAAIASCAFCGKMSRPRGQVLIVAASLTQGDVPFQHVKAFLQPRIDNEVLNSAKPGYKKKRFRVIDNTQRKEIRDELTGSRLVVLGSDSDKAHSYAPSFVLADEPAKWQSGGLKMRNALRTGMGKQVDAKFVALGTKPEQDDHWFVEMLDNPSEHTYIQRYDTDKDDPDFEERVIRQANPSYDHIESLKRQIHEEMEDAKKGIGLSAWRAYRLNQGTSEDDEKEMLVSKDDWKACIVGEAPPREGPVFVGIDIGGGVSMTAIVFYWPVTGRHEAYGCFPASPSLTARGKDDNVGERYEAMYKRGELFIYPGKAPNNKKFLKQMAKKIKREEIGGVSADRYKQKDVEQVIATAELNWEVDFRGVGRGMDGASDITGFQAEVLEGILETEESLLMDSAIAESVLHRDTNRNPALNKARSKGRNDPMQASLLAVGPGRRWREEMEEDEGAFELSDYVLTEMY